jgi:chromosome segregation ATPase
MSVGNRLVPAAPVVKAKKRGFLFPLLVNVSALVLLAAGFAALVFFHGQDDQGIRQSSAVLGYTERMLIQEIRRETNGRISEKEKEINDIQSKLSAVDAEYRVLQNSMESLTEAQKERAAVLLSAQEGYRFSLSNLTDEKTRIIEDSRLREAGIRAQAEQSQAGLALSQEDFDMAIDELKRLNTEQERAALVESQMNAYYAMAYDQINSGRLDEAFRTLELMKEFLNAPSLLGIRSFEIRKQVHLTAIAALEEALSRDAGSPRLAAPDTAAADTLNEESAAALAALEARYAALEQRASDQQRTIAAYTSQGSEQGRVIANFETRINELRTENARLNTENSSLGTANVSQQETLGRRDAEIVNLRAESSDLRQKLGSVPRSIEDAINAPEIQNQLGPAARQALIQTILQNVNQVIE